MADQRCWYKKQNNPKKEPKSGKARKAKGQKGGGPGEGIFDLLLLKIKRFHFLRRSGTEANGNAPYYYSGFSSKKVRISFSVPSHEI